jgi:hypothetical protein
MVWLALLADHNDLQWPRGILSCSSFFFEKQIKKQQIMKINRKKKRTHFCWRKKFFMQIRMQPEFKECRRE